MEDVLAMRDAYRLENWAQVIQAQAAGIKPDVYMNPIMLKPENDTGSELVVNGISRGIVKAADYYRKKAELIPDIMEAYEALDKTYDIIVIEGAGSPAEINLRENDIVNMGLARLVDAPVLLAGDINPGGVFAQLYGTLGLLDDEDRDRIKGLIINKFRGDISLLKPGIDELEEKCKKSVVGVVPMMKVRIEEEDSLTGNGALLTEDELRELPDIERQYDIMADTLEGSLDMKMISKIMGL